jgi:hypothetical protein
MCRGCGIGESKVSWRNLFTVLIFFWRAGYDNDKISEDACVYPQPDGKSRMLIVMVISCNCRICYRLLIIIGD